MMRSTSSRWASHVGQLALIPRRKLRFHLKTIINIRFIFNNMEWVRTWYLIISSRVIIKINYLYSMTVLPHWHNNSSLSEYCWKQSVAQKKKILANRIAYEMPQTKGKWGWRVRCSCTKRGHFTFYNFLDMWMPFEHRLFMINWHHSRSTFMRHLDLNVVIEI